MKRKIPTRHQLIVRILQGSRIIFMNRTYKKAYIFLLVVSQKPYWIAVVMVIFTTLYSTMRNFSRIQSFLQE